MMKRDFLEEILAHKREEVEKARLRVPEAVLRERAAVARGRRSLASALAGPGVRIIAELKRASPSRGPIRPDLDPAAYAAACQRGGAAALSVLTDSRYFGGGENDLAAARRAVSLPVLRKDFVLSAYQLYETAAMGADAVLLIVRILDDARLADLRALASELGLEALVEVHDENDLRRLGAEGREPVGVNNRNLASFETDLSVSRRIAGLLGPRRTVVAASGIGSRADVEAGLGAGIHCFLVGESIARSPDPEAFVRGLARGRAA
jgi:indole-3-glycerol phosphate synthase